jgi:restriction system protein
MPSQYPYRQTIRNDYLGVSKVVRAMTVSELNWLIDEQRKKWAEQEARRRQTKQREAGRAEARRHAENLKQQAEDDTQTAQQRLDVFRGILAGRVANGRPVDWASLLDRRTLPPLAFDHPKPDRDAIRLRLLGPPPVPRTVYRPRREQATWWESFLPFLRRARQARNAAAEADYEEEVAYARSEYESALARYKAREREVIAAYNASATEWNTRYREAKAEYAHKRDTLLAEQESHNTAVLDLRSRYEAGAAEAVEGYAQMALDRSEYPDGVPGEPDTQFDAPSQTLVVNFWLPGPADVPNVVEYRFVASRKEVKSVEMKAKDFATFYDDVIHQIGLRVASEVFSADYAGHVLAVVFNGWVKGIDPKTGKPFTSCILSFQAPRDKFLDLDLALVSPKECVRGLKGVTAGPLVMLAPVPPIMELKRDDDRFVESKEVLDHLRSDENLAAMEWEDFEHLVRELFEQEFAKTGGEVRVTQASRDRGVDAVAFDPDPIRGGKFVIQAKRYNMVVPVSAVRDLYGTMINEGAVKGILVTTSHFGRDSREFADGKPITLIDGENLVHLFQQHGRNVHIAMLPKGDPRRGVG